MPERGLTAVSGGVDITLLQGVSAEPFHHPVSRSASSARSTSRIRCGPYPDSAHGPWSTFRVGLQSPSARADPLGMRRTLKVGLIIASGLLASACGVSGGRASDAAGGGPAVTTPASTTSTTISGPAAIRQWEAANASVLSNLAAEINDFATAASPCSSEAISTCLATVGAACSGLEGAAQSAQSLPTISDAAAEQAWSAAVSDYIQGAQECTDSTGTANISLIEQAAQQLAAGKSQLLNLKDLAGSP